MDCEELIKSLWLRAEDKIRAMERDVKEEAARVEEEIARKIRALREEHEKSVAGESAKRAAHILSEAQTGARRIRLANRQKLAGRLYILTRSALVLLRNGEYSGVFNEMAMELPSLSWASVRVNPEDAGMARVSFPGSDIVTDNGISGGMEVTTADSSVRVINTLEKRLERAWDDLLPDLIKEYYETV